MPDPTTDVVYAGAKILAEGGFDGMIALGGGSPIDTAKAMGVMAANPGKMRDYKVPNVIPNMSMPLARHSDHGGYRVGGDEASPSSPIPRRTRRC